MILNKKLIQVTKAIKCIKWKRQNSNQQKKIRDINIFIVKLHARQCARKLKYKLFFHLFNGLKNRYYCASILWINSSKFPQVRNLD